VRFDKDTPIYSGMIRELLVDRDASLAHAESLRTLLADVEALHEPDGNGDCPTCGTPAPCLTHLLVRREITLDQAYAAVRDHRPVDLVAVERQTPPVPSLAQLLAAPTRGLDRFFEALLHAESGQSA
jgi:hypothetical protein